MPRNFLVPVVLVLVLVPVVLVLVLVLVVLVLVLVPVVLCIKIPLSKLPVLFSYFSELRSPL